MPFIVATYVYASSQGQRTHSARTKIQQVGPGFVLPCFILDLGRHDHWWDDPLHLLQKLTGRQLALLFLGSRSILYCAPFTCLYRINSIPLPLLQFSSTCKLDFVNHNVRTVLLCDHTMHCHLHKRQGSFLWRNREWVEWKGGSICMESFRNCTRSPASGKGHCCQQFLYIYNLI